MDFTTDKLRIHADTVDTSTTLPGPWYETSGVNMLLEFPWLKMTPLL